MIVETRLETEDKHVKAQCGYAFLGQTAALIFISVRVVSTMNPSSGNVYHFQAFPDFSKTNFVNNSYATILYTLYSIVIVIRVLTYINKCVYIRNDNKLFNRTDTERI